MAGGVLVTVGALVVAMRGGGSCLGLGVVETTGGGDRGGGGGVRNSRETRMAIRKSKATPTVVDTAIKTVCFCFFFMFNLKICKIITLKWRGWQLFGDKKEGWKTGDE